MATTVLCVGLDQPTLGLSEEAWRGSLEVLSGAGREDALDILGREEIAVLVLGHGLSAEAAARLLAEAYDRFPDSHTLNVVLSGDEDLSPFQHFIDHAQIYYLSPRPISSGELLAIVRAAMERYWELVRTAEPERSVVPGAGAKRAQRLLALARQIGGQGDVAATGRFAVGAIRDLLEVDHAYYLIYDADQEILWAKDTPTGDSREESAVAGLCSFVVRTAQAVLVPRADRDPRYDAEADNPDGAGSDRLMALPILGSGRRVLAVLVAARGQEKPEFTHQEQEPLELVAEQLAYALGRMELQSQVQRSLSGTSASIASGDREIFRREALEQQRFGHQGRGELLHLSPRWMQLTYWLLLCLVAAGFVFFLFGRMTEYAEGPALVRAQDKTEITASVGGTVDQVVVQPGQRVSRGEVLVRFYDAQEMAELKQTKREFEARLIDLLQSSDDEGARRTLAGLRAQRDLAEARLAERTARAPHPGVVSDILIHSGQHVAPGERLLSLTSGATTYRVIAMLPGHFRPQIQLGGPLRLELAGYEHVYKDLEVGLVGDQVVGPVEARRFLGPQLGDARGVSTPVVLVQATLPGQEFSFGGDEYHYHDGMYGTARLELRSESILISLVPGLRAILRRDDG